MKIGTPEMACSFRSVLNALPPHIRGRFLSGETVWGYYDCNILSGVLCTEALAQCLLWEGFSMLTVSDLTWLRLDAGRTGVWGGVWGWGGVAATKWPTSKHLLLCWEALSSNSLNLRHWDEIILKKKRKIYFSSSVFENVFVNKDFTKALTECVLG